MEFYGIEQYFARDDHGIEISLGVCADGIVVFRDMNKLSTFSWLALVYNKHYLDKHLHMYLHVHVHVHNHIHVHVNVHYLVTTYQARTALI